MSQSEEKPVKKPLTFESIKETKEMEMIRSILNIEKPLFSEKWIQKSRFVALNEASSSSSSD
jgi:hypothetical protein